MKFKLPRISSSAISILYNYTILILAIYTFINFFKLNPPPTRTENIIVGSIFCLWLLMGLMVTEIKDHIDFKFSLLKNDFKNLNRDLEREISMKRHDIKKEIEKSVATIESRLDKFNKKHNVELYHISDIDKNNTWNILKCIRTLSGLNADNAREVMDGIYNFEITHPDKEIVEAYLTELKTYCKVELVQ